MKVDVDIDKFTQAYVLKFNTEEFKSEHDLKMSITIITVFANDFDLDPELEPADMQEIVDKTLELDKTTFVVDINEDGIEVDI
jgi:hypothetical protein